jgi:hypothetical protein
LETRDSLLILDNSIVPECSAPGRGKETDPIGVEKVQLKRSTHVLAISPSLSDRRLPHTLAEIVERNIGPVEGKGKVIGGPKKQPYTVVNGCFSSQDSISLKAGYAPMKPGLNVLSPTSQGTQNDRDCD